MLFIMVISRLVKERHYQIEMPKPNLIPTPYLFILVQSNTPLQIFLEDCFFQGRLLLTWFNFNPNMDK